MKERKAELEKAYTALQASIAEASRAFTQQMGTDSMHTAEQRFKETMGFIDSKVYIDYRGAQTFLRRSSDWLEAVNLHNKYLTLLADLTQMSETLKAYKMVEEDLCRNP